LRARREKIPSEIDEIRRKSAGSARFRRRLSGIAVAISMGMLTKERVESVLGRVRPFMQADGGVVELLDVTGNSAEVRLTGMCAGCPSAHMTLYLGIESALREEIPEFESLLVR
jgi:Fe-S cluster biogenesis protein NfuA